MSPHRALPLAVTMVLLVAAAPTAGAWTVVCLGVGTAVCLVYRVVVEVKDDHVRIEVWNGDEKMLGVCVKPPDVWTGNCLSPPRAFLP